MSKKPYISFKDNKTGKHKTIQLSKLIQNPELYLDLKIVSICLAIAMTTIIFFGINSALK